MGKALCGIHGFEDSVNVWQSVVSCRNGDREEVLVDLPKCIRISPGKLGFEPIKRVCKLYPQWRLEPMKKKNPVVIAPPIMGGYDTRFVSPVFSLFLDRNKEIKNYKKTNSFRHHLRDKIQKAPPSRILKREGATFEVVRHPALNGHLGLDKCVELFEHCPTLLFCISQSHSAYKEVK